MYSLRYLYKDDCWFTLMARTFTNETEAAEYAEEFIKNGDIKEWFLRPLGAENES